MPFIIVFIHTLNQIAMGWKDVRQTNGYGVRMDGTATVGREEADKKTILPSI